MTTPEQKREALAWFKSLMQNEVVGTSTPDEVRYIATIEASLAATEEVTEAEFVENVGGPNPLSYFGAIKAAGYTITRRK